MCRCRFSQREQIDRDGTVGATSRLIRRSIWSDESRGAHAASRERSVIRLVDSGVPEYAIYPLRLVSVKRSKDSVCRRTREPSNAKATTARGDGSGRRGLPLRHPLEPPPPPPSLLATSSQRLGGYTPTSNRFHYWQTRTPSRSQEDDVSTRLTFFLFLFFLFLSSLFFPPPPPRRSYDRENDAITNVRATIGGRPLRVRFTPHRFRFLSPHAVCLFLRLLLWFAPLFPPSLCFSFSLNLFSLCLARANKRALPNMFFSFLLSLSLSIVWARATVFLSQPRERRLEAATRDSREILWLHDE